MITDAILTVLLTPLTFILQAIPTVPWPAWFSTSGPTSVVNDVAAWGASLGTINGWFPVDAFVSSLGIVFVVAGIHTGIKIVRLVVSLLTGGGGAV